MKTLNIDSNLRLRVARAVAAIVLVGAWEASAGGVIDLLPDMVVNPDRLTDHEFVNDVFPGRVHIRLSNATPNIGLGPLHIIGQDPDPGTGTQPVNQRIFRSNGSFFDRSAGVFVFHAAHNHVHIEDWAQYAIREFIPPDGVGPVIAQGKKTSFCLVDSARYLAVPPAGTPPMTPQFLTCGTDTQGISVGWEDLYNKDLPDQWIDITGLTPGTYWLESVVDPEDHVLEMDESNNVDRILLTIDPGELPEPLDVPVSGRANAMLLITIFCAGVVTLLTFVRAAKRGAG